MPEASKDKGTKGLLSQPRQGASDSLRHDSLRRVSQKVYVPVCRSQLAKMQRGEFTRQESGFGHALKAPKEPREKESKWKCELLFSHSVTSDSL